MVRYLANLETADYLFLYILTVDGRLFVVHGLPGTVEQSDAPSEAPWTRKIKASLDSAFRKVPLERHFDVRRRRTGFADVSGAGDPCGATVNSPWPEKPRLGHGWSSD